MSKVLATLAAGLFAASLSVYAVAADTAKADYKAAKAKISADYKSAKAECAKLKGAEMTSCKKDAEAKEKAAAPPAGCFLICSASTRISSPMSADCWSAPGRPTTPWFPPISTA